MEIYKLKDFAKWAKKENLSDEDFIKVVDEMEKGLLGDRLGAFVYKKRFRIAGRGKRGGARSILIYKQKKIAVFLYGYSKNEKSDLAPREEAALRVFAKAFIELLPFERLQKVKDGNLIIIEESET